ncbi:MAG: hypothetical protein IKR57_04795 [Bacilli bacterium]|nr:hypothetical protein [Bacilli bacterium]
MNKGSVPTAFAAIVVIALCFVGYMFIKDSVNQKKEQRLAAEASEIGELPRVKVSIDGNIYYAKLESNKTAKSFVDSLPLNISMNTNDSYSKKGLVVTKYVTAAAKQKAIKAGDIMLSGESEIIIFYKDFKSSDKYSKIGHIDNLGFIDGEQVKVYFNKVD